MRKDPKEESGPKRFFSIPVLKRNATKQRAQETKPPLKTQEVSDNSEDIDAFLAKFVYPVAEAWRQEDATNAKQKEKINNNVIHAIPLPKDIWKRHILSRLPEYAIAQFGEAYQSSPDLFNDFYNDRFKFKQFNPLPLFAQAKADGVNLNMPLLHNLCNKPSALQVIQPLHFEDNVSWVIATLCGDKKWLKNYPTKFTQLTTTHPNYQRSILYFLSFSGHIDIIKDDFQDILTSNKREQNQEISHIAASSGFFEISDYLEKFGTSADEENTKNGKTIAHYYAFYGDINRLTRTIVVHRSLITRYRHGKNLLFSAVAGGQIDMIKLLIQKRTDLLTLPDEYFGDTCFHVAAENGHAHVLKFFIKELKIQPPQELSKIQDLPLTRCGISGNWDCFWLLYPHYEKHSSLAQTMALIPMNAIGANLVDFFDQFVSRFGNTFNGKQDYQGGKISHFLLCSANIITIRKMINEFKVDLTEQDNNGAIALLTIATFNVKTTNSDLNWFVIANILKEFNPSFNDQLHLIPDNKGMTLQQFITDQHKENFFPFLQFNPSPALK